MKKFVVIYCLLLSSLLGISQGIDSSILIKGEGKTGIVCTSTKIDTSKSPLIIVNGFPYHGKLEDLDHKRVINVTVLSSDILSKMGCSFSSGLVIITMSRDSSSQKRIPSDKPFYNNKDHE